VSGWAAWVSALTAIRKNAMRSVLATLGILIAVAAVVATVAIGEGAREKVGADMAALGNNLLFVGSGSSKSRGSSGGAGTGRPLRLEDGEAMSRELSFWLGGVAPVMRYGGQAVFGHANWATTLIGTWPSYLEVRHWQLAAGTMFDAQADAGLFKQCVLGHTVARQLFDTSADPARLAASVGRYIRVRHMRCQVVGILQAKGQGGFGGDQDDIILMPYHTLVRRVAGQPNMAGLHFVVSARTAANAPVLEAQIGALLRQRHRLAPGEADDFSVFNFSEMQQAAARQMRTLSLLLGGVALISLVVGGIGIANVMLVSVTERTREIGIRMAVGATRRDILLQFLVEACMLTALGGAMGLGLGVTVASVAGRLADWPVALAWPVAAATLVVTALAGIAAGFYPAWRASRLDPIFALRYD
jgi:putative ABC transport system permease protein